MIHQPKFVMFLEFAHAEHFKYYEALNLARVVFSFTLGISCLIQKSTHVLGHEY